MSLLLGLAIALAALLAVEWRRPFRSVRVLAVLVAVLQLGFAEPLPGRAMRTVIGAPRAERATALGGSDSVGDYASGVLTMQRAVERDAALGTPYRAIAVGGLVWLALSPTIRRRQSIP